MKRPSHYMLPCAVLLVASFVVTGHLDVAHRAPSSHVADGAVVPGEDPGVAAASSVTAGGADGGAEIATAPESVKVASSPPKALTETQQGTVLDTMGFLLVGAEVALGEARTRTDADGRFALAVPRTMESDLLIGSGGHRSVFVRTLALAKEPLFVALEPIVPWEAGPVARAPLPQELHGEGLARTEAGAPLAGSFVVVAETGAMARVDELGRFRVPLPSTGATTLVLHGPASEGSGYVGRAEPFVPERPRGVVPLPDLIGVPAAQVRGTVRGVDGTPLRGVPLTIVAGDIVRTIATGDGGAFRLGGLPTGRCEVRAFAFRGALGGRLVLDIDERVEGCELRLRAADERRLRVVTEAGAPVASAIVATSFAGLRRGVARADEDGWVQVRAAIDDADYEVRAGADYQRLRVVAAPRAVDELVVALP